MRVRLCNHCDVRIEGKYLKCCESEMVGNVQRLTHKGDLCMKCWEKGVKR